MPTLLPVLLGLVLLLVPAAPAAAAGSIVEVPLPASQLEALGFDVAHSGSRERPHVVLHDAGEAARLGALTPFRTLVADVDRANAQARGQDRAAAAAPGDSALPSGRQIYRFLEDYHADMDRLVAESPSLVRRSDMPVKTIEGRTIRGVEIAQDVGRTDDGRPVFVVASLHHAREWPSGEIAMEFAIDLVERFEAGDARVQALLSEVRVVVVPVANPDGFVLSRTTEPLHRKNCRAVTTAEQALPCAGRSGVDPNRNYGALWGGPGASASASSDSYRGTGPFSEPETQAIHKFSQGRQITGFEAIHNIAGQVLRQPGNYDYGEVSPDEAGLKALGDAMAAATGYDSLLSYELYPVHGATEDWNYIAQGSYAYTIELGPGELSPLFQGPYQTHVVDQYVGGGTGGPAGKGMREALLLEAENAGDPEQHAILRASAPAGNVLRVRKEFETATSKVCLSGSRADAQGRTCTPSEPEPRLFDDVIDTTTVVPASGQVEWHVTPSTRPYVARDGGTEAWTLTCETPGGTVLGTEQVVVGRGDVKDLGAVCGEPPCDASLQAVACWSLGETSGLVALDGSGRGNHGSYLGGVTLGVPGALPGDRAISLDGVDDHVVVADAASLDVGDSFSLEGWIKRDDTRRNQQLFNKGGKGFHLLALNAANRSSVWLRTGDGTTIARTAGGVPADGRFHHVVATKDGSSVAVYVDGVAQRLVRPARIPVVQNTTAPLLISGATQADGAVAGDLDELAVYDRALTAAEVARRFERG